MIQLQVLDLRQVKNQRLREMDNRRHSRLLPAKKFNKFV
jgi:hypothetical protein